MSQQEKAYEALLAHWRGIEALKGAFGVLQWDQQTQMPPRGAAARAEQCAALGRAVHERLVDPQLAGWLDELGDVDGDGEADGDDDGDGDGAARSDALRRANVRLARRDVERARRVPGSLVAELARATALGHGVWARARAQRRFADFAPALTEIVALVREQARCLAAGLEDPPPPSGAPPSDGAARAGEVEPYDALLDLYEPGMRTARLEPLFARLRPRLVALVDRFAERARSVPDLGRGFDAAAQLALAREVARAQGYDFDAGRLDLAVHPFTAGVPGDVRITTRIDADDLSSCLYSTLHEVGHALYEQGIDPALAFSPAGRAVSTGVHESQSRLWENHVGRSRAFATWLFARVRAALPGLAAADADAFHRATNRVARSAIRTESDEATYDLHILVRFELERELVAGDLSVSDLEAAWNARMRRDLGLVPAHAGEGVLQDVHWSAGSFGYFPTYTLGNVYAAELCAAARGALGELDLALARGELAPLRDWLRDTIHRHGSRLAPGPLLRRALGRAPDERALVDYLERKLAAIYP